MALLIHPRLPSSHPSLEEQLFSSIFEFHFFIHSRWPASHPSWRITFSHPSWATFPHPSGIIFSHPSWNCLVSSILDHPCLMHPGLPCLIHPSIHPFWRPFKIHPWGGGLVGRPLMTVSWKSSGHMVSPCGPWPRSMKVVFVRGWKSGYNLVNNLDNQPKH